MSACLADDDVLELVRGRALGELSAVEAHLADCPACSALVAALIAGETDDHAAAQWGALVGQTLGPYRLEGQIGAGAAGAVYRGWDQRLRRHVAVKVLVEDGVHGRWVDTEARAAAAIAHVNVVTIHDVGRAGGHAYVVTELVEGESLRSVLAAGALPITRVVRLGVELARGLAAAHTAGVIHRDLKPENLLVATDGTLKILDFGLAKLADGAGSVDATIPGTLLGTAGYMAPEQARGDAVDARADLFAAGAILYEAAVGRRAFDGASHAERLSAVLRDTPSLDGLGALAPIIARCLAKEPRDRFQSAADLRWALEQPTSDPPRDLPRDQPGDQPRDRERATSEPTPARQTWPTRRTVLLSAAATGALGFLAGRFTRRAAPRPPAPPALRQLTFRQGRLMTARFGPQATDIYFGAAWDGAPLTAHTLRLDGGLTRPLAVPAADVLAVSRTQLALCLGRRNVDGQSATGRLALAPLDGGLPRELALEIQEADFTPDGRELAVITRTGHTFRLELPAGTVLLDDAPWITDPRVSPDGRQVACLVHPDPNDDQGAIVVVDRATRTARTVSDGWASLAGLAWDRRGDRLWFTGSRTSADNSLRTVTLDGTTREIFSTIGRLRLHDLAPGGRLLVSRDVWRLRTMVGGEGTADVDRSLTPFSMVTHVSDDGAALIVAEFGDVDDVNGVYVVPAAGGERLRLGPGWPKALSPDGSRVLAVAFERIVTGRPETVLYDVRGGGRTTVELAPLARVMSAGFLDATHLVVEAAARAHQPRIWRVDLTTRTSTPLTAEGTHGTVAVDPLTSLVGFIDGNGAAHLLDPATATDRTLATDLTDHVACTFLGPDLIVRTTTSPITLSRLSPTGVLSPHLTLTPPPLGLKGVDAVALSRATTRHAYSYGQELSELFLLELA